MGTHRCRFIRKGSKGDEIFAADEDVELLLEILNEDIYKGLLTGRRLVANKKAARANP